VDIDIIMDRDISWQGKELKKGKLITIEHRHGHRWVRNKIAHFPIDISARISNTLFLTPQERLKELEKNTKLLILVEEEEIR
jgi:hypothetical protein